MGADVQQFLKEWRSAVDSDDHGRITSMLADEIAFYSPVIYKPASDRVYIEQVLKFVAESIENFHYTDEFEQPGGCALVFSGNVGDLGVEGIDLIKLNDAGLITELKVMLRPLNTVMVLAQSMKERFAALQGAEG